MDNRGNERANITFQLGLAFVVAIALFVVLGAVIFVEIPARNDTAFNILLGAVIGWIGAMIAFGFPSNIGNAKKDDTINTLANSASAPMTVTTTTTAEKPDGQGTSPATDRGGAEQTGSGVAGVGRGANSPLVFINPAPVADPVAGSAFTVQPPRE